MGEDLLFLNDIFNLYYEKARAQHAVGNFSMAKRNYLLSAETLMKISKKSSPTLKKAQFDRAMRIVQIADTLDGKQQSNSNKNSVKRQGQQSDALAEEDSENKWACAEIPQVYFSDIVGLEDVKETVRTRMINPLKYPEKYAIYGKHSGGGVLLYGPPGTGKTMIAKAIACEVGAKYYAIKGSDILSKWVGESESNINDLFNTARKDKLAIIFIDEMDSLFGSRGQDIHNDKRVNEFLQQIDGFGGRAQNILLLGATNRPWDVDSAAVRSGRFSEKIYIPLPDAPARMYLFEKYLKGAPIDADIDWKLIVAKTKGYSGADIEEICDRAKEAPLKEYIATDRIIPVSQKDVFLAIDKVKCTVDQNEIAKFEHYAGIKYFDNIDTLDNGKAPADTTPSKSGSAVSVTLASDTINLLPNKKPVIEFALSEKFNNIYINIDGANYACSTRLNVWTSELLNIKEAGEYVVVVSCEKEVARFTIKFSKGIIDNNIDL